MDPFEKPGLAPTVERVKKALVEHGVKIFFKITNNKLDFSLSAPPEDEVGPEWLAGALIDGYSSLKRSPHPRIEERVIQSDGRKVTYTHLVWYDFANERLFASLEDEKQLQQVIAFVAQQLHQKSLRDEAKKAGENN